MTQTKAESPQVIHKLSKRCLWFYALIVCGRLLCSVTGRYFTDRLIDLEKVKGTVILITFLRRQQSGIRCNIPFKVKDKLPNVALYTMKRYKYVVNLLIF